MKNMGIFHKIRHLIMLKSYISDTSYYVYTKININSNDDLPLEKTITMHNVIMLI